MFKNIVLLLQKAAIISKLGYISTDLNVDKKNSSTVRPYQERNALASSLHSSAARHVSARFADEVK